MMTKDKIVIASELDMKFDEAMELFSDETLNTMRMGNVVGGGEEEDPGVNIFDCPPKTDSYQCLPGFKDNCPCPPPVPNAVCLPCNITHPSLPPIPTLIMPSAPPLNTIIP